jgi:hypothetical protein
MVKNEAAIVSDISSAYDIQTGAEIVWSALATTERSPDALPHPKDSAQEKLALIAHVRGEIHKLLCTLDKDYDRKRKLLGKTSVPAISLLTGLVVGHFGVSMAAASAVCAALLLVPLKIGIRSWCKVYLSSRHSLTQAERDQISKLAGKE